MKNQKKQVAQYRGLLAKPMAWTSVGLDPNNPPWWFNGTLDDWARHVSDARCLDMRRWCDRVMELYRHFDIDVQTPGAGFELALALAKRHVPAFQTGNQHKARGRPTGLNAVDTLRFLVELDKQEKLMRGDSGKTPSRRKLAEQLRKSRFCRDRRLSAETVRKLLRQLKSAKSAFQAGTATEFQRQYYEQLMPMVYPGLPTGKLGI